MGAPPHSIIGSLNLKAMILENKGTTLSTTTTNIASNNNGSLWSKVLELQSASLKQTTRRHRHLRINRKVMMKRRRITRQEGSTRSENNGIERRVRTLQNLVPHRTSQGLEGLFSDTAAYIMSLQMRVRVMQIMVDVLEDSQDHQ